MGEKKRHRVDWLNHLFGLIGVLLGVLIAFWLNNWSEQNRASATLNVALENIKSEVVKNNANLDTILVSNRRLYEFLTLYLKSMNNEMKLIAPKEEWDALVNQYPQYLNEDQTSIQINVDLFQLSDVAWSAAHRTDAFSSMKYELAFILEKAYNLQEKVNEFDTALILDLKGIDNTKESFRRLQRSLGFSIDLATNLQEKNYPELENAIDAYLSK